jgi:hypothetical protein
MSHICWRKAVVECKRNGVATTPRKYSSHRIVVPSKENAVANPEVVELKAHLPSKDFEVSKQFYQDIGFTLCWSTDGLALLHYGPHGVHGLPAILLQNDYVKELAENLQMHLLVKDVDAWWAHLQAKQISQTYGVEIGPPEDREWKMRDFTLIDPSGVFWRIAQNID